MLCLLSLWESKTQAKSDKCSVGEVKLDKILGKRNVFCKLTVCGTCHSKCILGDIFGLDTLGMTFCCFVLFLFLDFVESRLKVVDAIACR